MIILAIDTAANLCAAAIHDNDGEHGDGERGRCVIDLGKGHAERLFEVIAAAQEQAGTAYGDLDAVAVSIGPGSFTGVRVGVATARGLSLALKIPAIGVSTLEALAWEARETAGRRPVLVAIKGSGDRLFVAGFDAGGTQTHAPAAMSAAEAAAMVTPDILVAGSGAAALADATARPLDATLDGNTADIAAFARLGLAKSAANPDRIAARPKPLYLREADAKPQAGFALARKG